MTLDDYLNAQGARRFVWGVSDCVQFGLGWAREATGRPLAPFCSYGSRAEAKRALESRGGLERVVRDWMAQNGFAPTSDPDHGDIGLAPRPPQSEDIIAGLAIVIRSGPWWVGKSPRGIRSVLAGKDILAWRIV